jgi:hypothetical protein
VLPGYDGTEKEYLALFESVPDGLSDGEAGISDTDAGVVYHRVHKRVSAAGIAPTRSEPELPTPTKEKPPRVTSTGGGSGVSAPSCQEVSVLSAEIGNLILDS